MGKSSYFEVLAVIEVVRKVQELWGLTTPPPHSSLNLPQAHITDSVSMGLRPACNNTFLHHNESFPFAHHIWPHTLHFLKPVGTTFFLILQFHLQFSVSVPNHTNTQIHARTHTERDRGRERESEHDRLRIGFYFI